MQFRVGFYGKGLASWLATEDFTLHNLRRVHDRLQEELEKIAEEMKKVTKRRGKV